MKPTKSVVAVAVCASLLSACATDDQLTKQEIGTGAGVVAGALVGQFFGKGTGRIVATLAGAAIGGYIGNRIGASLDESDRAAVSQQSAHALAEAKDGQAISWSNPDSGASAEIVTSNTRTETRKVTVLRDKRVEKPGKLELIGKTYQASSGVRLRSAPSTSSDIVGGMQAGENFNAVGKVPNSEWIVVGKGNRTLGYVSSAFVRPAPAKTETETAALRPAMDLDQVAASAKKEGIDLDAEGFVADEMVASTQCRTVDVKVSTKDGKKEQDTMNACRAADGAWEIL